MCHRFSEENGKESFLVTKLSHCCKDNTVKHIEYVMKLQHSHKVCLKCIIPPVYKTDSTPPTPTYYLITSMSYKIISYMC